MPRFRGDRAVADKLTGRYEINNHMQGRTESGTPKKMGPVKNASGNPTSGGGINRPTKGKK